MDGDGVSVGPHLGAPVSSDASVAKAYLILKGLTASWVHDFQVNGKQIVVYSTFFFSLLC